MPLITATVVKEETSSKLGIAFERISENKAMTIKLIRDDSLFKGSDLVEGLIVASAAGKDMEGMSPKDCADALREAPGGEEISLVCKGAVVTVEKDKKKRFKKEPKIGISFKSTTSAPGKVYVSNIKEDSKFYGTDLTIGHQVLAINGEPCPPRVTEAVDMLTKKGVTKITLTTVNPEDEVVVPKAKEEPAEVFEEKKDDGQPAVTAPDAPSEAKPEAEAAEEEDLTPEGNKSLIDTMFGVCMC
jgi:predicted metalloprotease with PDZ domain